MFVFVIAPLEAHACMREQLAKVDARALQTLLIQNADMSQLNAETKLALETEQLNMLDLLGAAFIANEGILLFKPTECKNFEVVFTHRDEVCGDVSGVSTNDADEPAKDKPATADKTDETDKTNKTDIDIQALVQELDLGPEWMELAKDNRPENDNTDDTT